MRVTGLGWGRSSSRHAATGTPSAAAPHMPPHSGTCVAPMPCSVVSVSRMGASQASFKIWRSSAMRGYRGLAPVHCGGAWMMGG